MNIDEWDQLTSAERVRRLKDPRVDLPSRSSSVSRASTMARNGRKIYQGLGRGIGITCVDLDFAIRRKYRRLKSSLSCYLGPWAPLLIYGGPPSIAWLAWIGYYKRTLAMASCSKQYGTRRTPLSRPVFPVHRPPSEYYRSQRGEVDGFAHNWKGIAPQFRDRGVYDPRKLAEYIKRPEGNKKEEEEMPSSHFPLSPDNATTSSADGMKSKEGEGGRGGGTSGVDATQSKESHPRLPPSLPSMSSKTSLHVRTPFGPLH